MLKRLLFFLLFAFSAENMLAQTMEQEANLKAVFIYNFTKYIDWDTNENEFTIGVLGNSPVTSSLYEIAKTNTVKNKRIILKIFSKPENIVHCNILFIPKTNSFPVQSIFEKTDRGMLTISEEPGMAKQGTAFNFVIVNDKLKFEANLKAIYLAGLKAGSQLLKLGIIVD